MATMKEIVSTMFMEDVLKTRDGLIERLKRIEEREDGDYEKDLADMREVVSYLEFIEEELLELKARYYKRYGTK